MLMFSGRWPQPLLHTLLSWLWKCLSLYFGDDGVDLLLVCHFTVQNEEFVVLGKEKEVPHTRHVRGSNYCIMNVFPDRITGRAIILSVVCLQIFYSTFIKRWWRIRLHFFFGWLSSKEFCCRSIISWRELLVKLYRILTWWWEFQRIQGLPTCLCFLSTFLFMINNHVSLHISKASL